MDFKDVEQLQLDIVRAIGRDSLYLQSADAQRHLDPISVLGTYAGYLFLAFATAAGRQLWSKLKTRAEKLGESAADVVWNTVTADENEPQHETPEQLAARIQKVAEDLRRLASALAPDDVADAFARGENALASRLTIDHVPEDRSRNIAFSARRAIEPWLV
jgi:hypothetical protein